MKIPETEEIVQYLQTQPPGRIDRDMESHFKIDRFYLRPLIRQLEARKVVYMANGYVSLNPPHLWR
jgi:hypothetical protein